MIEVLRNEELAMSGRLEGRPELLLLADARTAELLREPLLTLGPVAVAGSILEAEIRLRQSPREILVVDGPLVGTGRPLPDTLLCGPPVLLVLDDLRPVPLRPGTTTSLLWLPRALVLAHPPLLLAALDQAVALVDLNRRLTESQGQVEHLLALLSTAGPSTPGPRWYSHRVMLERLVEEVARVERHGGTLSVILAEVAPEQDEPTPILRLAEHLSQRKRSCDVLGQYGPQGLMLLLPQTQATGARECCTRLAGVVQHSAETIGQSSPWRLDYGISSYQPPHTSAKSLLRLAEEELERSRGRESL